MTEKGDQDFLQDLGEGLVLRRARQEDTETLVAFNTRLHEEEDPGIGEAIGVWTTDLMTGEHPEVDANIWPVD